MADQDPVRDEPTAWDRVGQMLGDMAGAGQRVANRNLKLWNDVAGHLRDEQYTVNDMTSDVARSWTAAMDNLDDLWALWTRVPDRERVAMDLPTAFLLFQRSAGEREIAGAPAPRYSVADPVWIRLPAGLNQPPERAVIRVSGPSTEGAKALEDSLTAVLGRGRHAYQLVTNYPREGVVLSPGTYSGVVYVGPPNPRPLANLRIVVE